MQKFLRLSGIIDAVNERIGRLISWLVVIMVLLGAYNAITRKLSQTIGIDLSSNAYIEAQWFMFSLVFLWGAGYALKNQAHVRVDILYARVSDRFKAWINIIGTCLFLFPLSALILWVSYSYAADSWAILEGSPDPGGLPRYLIKSAIPIAFILLIVQGISELIKQIAFLKGFIPFPQVHEEEGI
ncbi:TRAP transporter small permease subunit [Sedimenticola hydrogenitrophicus]|uniref:TRAP transporter small permease subunit n=1 Tax=Sedimenticola hydrogenitrophicus TaxID=2967975 RepID=UPI0023AFDEF9|nr:TRAP transporter small permease subunit [Sedimenticola hydrogenitrophicus]